MEAKNIEEIIRKAMSEYGAEKASANENNALGITLDMAKQLNEAVMKKAREIGVKSVCAVVNAGARPVAIECDDDSYIASYDIALNKAFTSVSLKMKTSKLCELSQPNAPLYGIQFTNNNKIVIFGGGTPLVKNGIVIGGFGVSGGSAEEDTYLGDYAEEVFDKLFGNN